MIEELNKLGRDFPLKQKDLLEDHFSMPCYGPRWEDTIYM
jgi:hypothetical protein